MVDGCLEARAALEEGEDMTSELASLDDEAAASAEPLVAPGKPGVAAAPSAASLKGMRIATLALVASLAAAALLALVASGRMGGSLRQARRGAPVDHLVQEVATSTGCLPLEHGVDYIGGQGKALNNVPNLDACRAKCSAVPSCTMWTWVAGTGIPLTANQCWLKSGRLHKKVKALPGGAETFSNYVSGCLQVKEAKALAVSPYILNYQADHAAGEQPGLGCGPPAPAPGIWWTAAPSAPPVQVSLLTYNLAWWQVFDVGRPGEFYFHKFTKGNTAMTLIKSAVASKALDVMAFQECNNVGWLLQKSGLAGAYTGFQGFEGTCLAFNTAAWTQLAQGQAVVAEDTKLEYWGRRMGMWLRLLHKASGKTVFVMNHHGPLPVSSGGVCGAPATVRRLLSMITANAHSGEPVILMGDFNAEQASQTIGLLKGHLHSVMAGTMHNGIDNIFSNIPPASVLGRANLGSGGSDHDALHALLRI